MSLLNPGTLTEYEGPARNRRSRGYVRVREPAHGFFIAGSAIEDMNGIYGRVRNQHLRFLTSVKHPIHLCYRHDESGWLMALVDIPPKEVKGKERTEESQYYYEDEDDDCDTLRQWRFIDKTGRDRFSHKGDTIIPGSGTSWKHLHDDVAAKQDNSQDSDDDDDGEEVYDDVNLSGTVPSASASGRSRADRGEIVTKDEEDVEDDEDELPWQVIALLDPSVLEDLRFSSACRDSKIKRALKGLDVQQPPESTIGGFLEAERRAIQAAAVNDNDDGEEIKGWLYRVVANDGVDLFSAPHDDEELKVGSRSTDDFIRVVEVQGRWLRLAASEKPMRDPPLGVGDSVCVISGHYEGERGKICEELNSDTREFGVRLHGYRGTGYLHVSELKRDGPIPGIAASRKAARRKKQKEDRQREIRRQQLGFRGWDPDTDDEAENLAERLFGGGGWAESSDDDSDGYLGDESYGGPLWVATTDIGTRCSESGKVGGSSLPPLVVPVRDSVAPSLETGEERADADLYDRPFEPRIEGGHSSSEADSDRLDDEDAVESEAQNELDQLGTLPQRNTPRVDDSKSPMLMEGLDAADQQEGFAVGTSVTLQGLKTSKRYNGMLGTVITKINTDGRCGVRLDPVSDTGDEDSNNLSVGGTEKRLLVKLENIHPTSADVGNTMGDTEQGEMERAARILNVCLDTVGLGDAIVHQKNSRQVLDAVLRAAERDINLHRWTADTKISQKMQSDGLQVARNAHSVLVHAVMNKAKAMTDDDGQLSNADSGLYGIAPHVAAESGFLGLRAKNAAVAASDKSSLDRIESGVASLKEILTDEQARLSRRQVHGRETMTEFSTRQLEEAEKAASSVNSDSDSYCSADDCLRLRLTIVRALLRCGKEADAITSAETVVGIYPNSASALLWHGRCQLRRGLRVEAMRSLARCVELGPNGGVGDAWAHGEGVKRLRSLKRTLRCEFIAKDSYERGKFADAASEYGKMMAEYDADASDDKWGKAEALCARAACHRRDRDLDSALADCDLALSLFPRYSRALFRRAVCLLEAARPNDAKLAFEQLLRVDRKWPNLLDWLIRSEAQARRQKANNQKPGFAGGTQDFGEQDSTATGNEDYYSILGVSTDATDAQLKRAYRLQSLKTHPDKKGGSSEAFQLVATAYETLCDPEKRQLYDDGVDMNKKKRKKGPYEEDSSESEDEDGNKKKSIREEVERRYFPENFKFWPFGDPFINKRRYEARKRREAEREKERKARRDRFPWRHTDNAWDPWDV